LIRKFPKGVKANDGNGRSPYFVAATSDAPLDVVNALIRFEPSNLFGPDPFGVLLLP
jgi:hypothetical protein